MRTDFFGEGPVCVAMLVCNDVIEDKRSGNKTVVGIFNFVGTAQLPAVHPTMTVLASVTNAYREIAVALILRGPEGNEVLRAEAGVPARGPGDTVDLQFELKSLMFNEFGDYVFELEYEGHVIGARKFTVISTKARVETEPPQPAPPPPAHAPAPSANVVPDLSLPNGLEFGLFLFDSHADGITGNYVSHAKRAVREAVAKKEPRVRDGDWKVFSGDLFEPFGIQSLLTDKAALPDASRLDQGLRRSFSAGVMPDAIPYAVGVFLITLDVLQHADKSLKEAKVAGYLGLVTCVLSDQDALIRVASSLSLPMTPFHAGD